jgi:tannase/feruloyl esterase
VYVGQAALADLSHTIPASKYPMIHRAVVETCDTLDGLKDGLIGNPAECRFDFKTLACSGEDVPSCLTSAQVVTAEKVTSPAVSAQTGEVIFPGLALGTELGWVTKVGGPAPNPLGADYFRFFVFKDPKWDWRTFDLDSALAQAERLDNGTANASPDLTAFRRRGGKLLMYHGWRDQNFSAQATADYYRRVLEKTGTEKASEWVRLFLAPGMGHCGGGEGPNAFDVTSALEEWVEQGRAPAAITASHRTEGKVDRTRLLCPYPQVAKYNGAGSIDEAANFACVSP